MLDAALAYAARGWPVFPCDPRSKRPLSSNGFKDANTDADLIRDWWTRWPQALIGVATGRALGAFVIDLDAGVNEKTGEVFELEDLLRSLASETSTALPRTWTADTPRGGRHIYF